MFPEVNMELADTFIQNIYGFLISVTGHSERDINIMLQYKNDFMILQDIYIYIYIIEMLFQSS